MTTHPPQNKSPIALLGPHWIEFVSSALPLMFVSLVAVCLTAPAFLKTVMLVLPCAFFIRGVATVFSTSVTLHQGEVELKSGILQRATISIPISRIESVGMRQSILGRTLDYGTLTIRTIGGDSVSTINLGSPEVFRKQIYFALSMSI
ncbi:PH domain-containing protein [Pseudomonas sp. W22_MBD1_FP4]|uniref:PH domain-containing protein n=1 Tax=Pseudomonas sp. W22_MBD1_FP4 TaxID=3240272 RepID=UPI003F98F022